MYLTWLMCCDEIVWQNWRPFLPHQVLNIYQRVVGEHRPMSNLQVRTHIIPDCEMDSKTVHEGHEGHYLRGIPSRTTNVPAMKTFPCTLLRNPLSSTIAQQSQLDTKPTPSGSVPAPTVPHLQQLACSVDIGHETPTALPPPNPTPRLQKPPSIIIEAGRPTPDPPKPPTPNVPHLQRSASTIIEAKPVPRPTPGGKPGVPPTPKLQHPPEDMALQFLWGSNSHCTIHSFIFA